jgi:transposase
LEGIYVHSKESLDDRALIRHRTTLLKLMGGTKSRIKHLLYNNGVSYPDEFSQKSKHWNRRFISWLQHDVQLLSDTRVTLDLLIEELLYFRARILDVNRKIRVLANTDKYRRQYENLISIPGIGAIISMCLLTEIDDISRFSNQRQFASFLGIVPVMKASGDDCYVGEKTFRGNKALGPKIIEAAWITIKHDGELAAKFGQLCLRGMKRNKAIVRIARKLSNRIFSILKNDKEYICR